MIRVCDFFLALLGLIFGAPVLLVIFFLGLLDTGTPLFWQERVGRNQRPFNLVKFRTMTLGTVSIATHLASSSSVTRLGLFLRKTKLDELPQLWNVLRGEMSLVGPRPGLFNQQDLMIERAKRGVYDVRPGITGLAQINNIDMSTPCLLAETDQEMISSFTFCFYLKCICLTISGKGGGDRLRPTK